MTTEQLAALGTELQTQDNAITADPHTRPSRLAGAIDGPIR